MQARVAVLVIAACGSHHAQPSRDAPGTGIDGTGAGDAAHDAAVDTAPPADAPITTMTVDSSGGTLTTPDGVVLVIPAGALTTPVTITITTVTNNVPGGAVGPVFELSPDGTQLAVPAQLTLPYDPNQLGSTNPQDLTVATRIGASWQGEGFAAIDGMQHTASAFITHFSQWAIIPSPPNSGCTVNYDCMKACAGSVPPEVCCSSSRGTCRAVLHSSFPSYVACYATCVGTPMVNNFGNSKCMSGCCTSHGWTATAQGACYDASATQSQAQAVLDCARTCFAGTDQQTLCGSGNIQFDACAWDITMSPDMGGECGPMLGVNSQILSTGLPEIYSQIWGNPQVIQVTGGSYSSSSITIGTACANGTAASGTMSGTWAGAAYSGNWTFSDGTNSSSGTFTVTPRWPSP